MTLAEHDIVVELMQAYALDILDADEAERVQRHLLTCPTCQAELRAFQQIVDQLPLASPEPAPSPLLKQRLLRHVQNLPVATPSVWAQIRMRLRQLFAPGQWPRTVFVLGMAMLLLGVVWFTQHQVRIREIAMTGTEAAPKASGLIVLGKDTQNATLIVENLPTLDASQQYQLWLINDDGTRLSGGVFSVNDEGYSSLTIQSPRPLTDFKSFGITIEPTGGSDGPTGARVLEYNL